MENRRLRIKRNAGEETANLPVCTVDKAALERAFQSQFSFSAPPGILKKLPPVMGGRNIERSEFKEHISPYLMRQSARQVEQHSYDRS